MQTIEQSLLRGLVLIRNGVPIYVQIREQLLRAIGTPSLPAGARMPTMRQVAVALKVDLNTVRHAYEDLQRDGHIILRRGQGSFVADQPAGDPGEGGPERLAAPEALDDIARNAMAQARRLGLEPVALAERIAHLIATKETSS